MAEQTFAQQMLSKYEDLLLQCAGMKSINVDGLPIAYEDLEAKYLHWKRAVRAEQGGKDSKLIRPVNIIS